MTRLDPEFCRRIRQARRDAGLSQTAVAREAGCKQSALSMFEQGDGTKLNDDAVRRLCGKFGIEFPGSGEKETAEDAVSSAIALANPGTGYCPNPACPSHETYEVDGRMFARPDMARQDPAGGKFCAVCGEVLERRCPECGMRVHAGAVCSFCGKPYVSIA